MKNLDMPRMTACFITMLVVGTLLEQFTPLAAGMSLKNTLISNAALGIFIIGLLIFMGYLRRDDRHHF